MIKKIISYILVFVLIIMLIANILVTILSQTILKEEFMLNAFAENDYYSRTYNNIYEKFQENTMQVGLDENVLEGIITRDKVDNDVKMLIKYLYNGTNELNIEVETIRQKLQENINEQIKENKKTLSKEEEKAVNKYITIITSIYNRSIVYADSYIPTAQKVIIQSKSIIDKVKIVLYISTVILLVIIVIINRKKSLKYLSIASLATGLLLILTKIMVDSNIKIKNLLILNKAFSDVLIYMVEKIIFILLITGIVTVIIGLGLSFIEINPEISKSKFSKSIKEEKQKMVTKSKHSKH